MSLRAEEEKGGSGIEAIYDKLDGKEFKIRPDQLQLGEEGWVASYTLHLPSEGIHNLGFWAKDKAGNVSRYIPLMTVRIDKTGPSITLSPSLRNFTAIPSPSFGRYQMGSQA